MYSMTDNGLKRDEIVHLKILFFATLKEIVGSTEIQLEIEKGKTISDLKNRLLLEYPRLQQYLPIILVSINQNFAFDTDEILEDAEVAFFPPVSGGQLDKEITVEVSTDEFDFNALISHSIQNSTGAIVMFTGVIRGETNNSEHPKTSGLTYEAYTPMAEAKMRQVAEEMLDRWPTIEKIVIIQRVGYMDAGTPTVVVLCTSPHRHTGVFEAARYGIDRVKEIVPIWKKEIGPEGETWIEGDYIPGSGD